MPYKHKEITKLYYSISEVADMFDVNASLIRYWEKEFDVLKPKKNAKGNRLFTQKDIDNLKLIYHLVKERGFTLDGANNRLKEDRKSLEGNYELVQSLNKVKDFLEEIKANL